jgi:hypothetical protein
MNLIAVDFKAFGGSQLLSHLIVSYPEQFVEVVLLPLTKSIDYDSPIHSLLESITYQYNSKSANVDITLDSTYSHPVMNFIYPYVYGRMGLEVWNRGEEESFCDTPKGAESMVYLNHHV